MSQYYEEDIPIGELDFMPISLLSNHIKVLVIGGGRAGSIKAKAFINRGCSVTVVSKDFITDFDSISGESIQLIQMEYRTKFLKDKHLVVIAVSDEQLINQIKQDCENNAKLFLCCKKFRDGLFIVPSNGETEQGIFAFHTKSGSPATAKFIKGIIGEQLKEYDSFIEYASNLRNSLKGNSKLTEIMRFVNTEDFLMFFKKGKHEMVLNLFYGGVDYEA